MNSKVRITDEILISNSNHSQVVIGTLQSSHEAEKTESCGCGCGSSRGLTSQGSVVRGRGRTFSGGCGGLSRGAGNLASESGRLGGRGRTLGVGQGSLSRGPSRSRAGNARGIAGNVRRDGRGGGAGIAGEARSEAAGLTAQRGDVITVGDTSAYGALGLGDERVHVSTIGGDGSGGQEESRADQSELHIVR